MNAAWIMERVSVDEHGCWIWQGWKARAAVHITAERRTPPSHCPHGHAYDEANTYYRRNGWWQCRTCRREDARKRSA